MILLAPALKVATLYLLAGRVAFGGGDRGFLEMSSGPDTLGLPAGGFVAGGTSNSTASGGSCLRRSASGSSVPRSRTSWGCLLGWGGCALAGLVSAATAGCPACS